MCATTLLPSENSVERVAGEAPLLTDAGLSPLLLCAVLRSLLGANAGVPAFAAGSLSPALRAATAKTFTGTRFPCRQSPLITTSDLSNAVMCEVQCYPTQAMRCVTDKDAIGLDLRI